MSKAEKRPEGENENVVKEFEVRAPKPAIKKVRFIEWFADACNGRFKNLKPHHMNEVREYFIYLGISDPADPLEYDSGMAKYGFIKV